MIALKKHIAKLFLLTTVTFISLFGSRAWATVKLPAIFSDHMVLQQKAMTAFWGWADRGERVTIETGWSKTTTELKADASGKWSVSVQTPAAGGPYIVTVNGSHNSVELQDVLIGEVWLCSGQSNMVFSLKGSEHAEEEAKKAIFPNIRYFSVTRQYATHTFDDSPGAVWKLTTPETAPSFSAVAYYFAKKLHGQLKVPIGIVYSAWGGTPAEAWTPRPVLQSDTVLTRYMDRWKYICDHVGKDSAEYHVALNNWEKNKTAGAKKPAEPQTLYYFERPWREPGVLFNGMIQPIIPFTIKGALWYQGESNVAYADEYFRLLSAMIDSWRKAWGMEGRSQNFPFYVVQIAAYGYNSLDAAARLREAEYEIMKRIPNTGTAVTVDLGDMDNIHYKRKKEVGDRLALIALARDYGYKKTAYKGPEAKGAYLQNRKAVVEFESSSNLTAGNAAVKGFEIGYASGDTLRYVAASAKIEGNKVIVWNDEVKDPVEVRYAWLLVNEANLFNKDGLPAFPFRTKVTGKD